MAQFGRALRSGRRGRKFKSCHLDHVGTSYARSDFLFHKKSVTRSTVPLLPQKVSLGSSARLQAPSLRFAAATNLLRVRVRHSKMECHLFYCRFTIKKVCNCGKIPWLRAFSLLLQPKSFGKNVIKSAKNSIFGNYATQNTTRNANKKAGDESPAFL